MGDVLDQVLTTAEGRRVGCLQRGPAGGRPVIYLHGMPGCRLEQHLLPDEVLQNAGLRLISLDRPGWGQTTAQAGTRLDRVRDILPVMDLLGIERAPVMANSSGGSYALTIAAAAPDRVERVVLVSAQMPYDEASAIKGLKPGQHALLPLLRLGRTADLIAGIEAYRSQLLDDPLGVLLPGFENASSLELELLEKASVKQLLVEDIQEGVGQQVDGLLDDLLAWVTPFEVDVTSIGCPVRAAHGTADDWEPLANLERILAQVPDARLTRLEGLNHLGPWLDPELLVGLALDEAA